MALSATERKRRQLERERRELLPLTDSTYPYLKTPFFEHLGADPNWSDVELCFELMGFDPPDFSDDRGPEVAANEGALDPNEDPSEAFKGSEKSIGRAEVMIDLLYSAAVQMSGIVNAYKKSELAERKAELERRDLSNAAARKEALTASAQIAKLEEALDKNVRITLHQWRIKGI